MILPFNIVVGNMVSLVAGIFLLISLCVNNDKKTYKFQFLNTFVLMIASVFFNSWIGAFLMAIASARLFMVYKDRFTLRWMVFFLVLSVILGFAINTLGFIGLIPIVAVAQITICNYAYKNIRWIKLSLIVNEAFYIFYFYLVFDLVSTVVQVITVAVGCVSYVRLVKSSNSDMEGA